MQQDRSVKDLRSKFDSLDTNPKPALATKPHSSLQACSNGTKPVLKAKPSLALSTGLPDGSPKALQRTCTNDSELSDPFGSPAQSPAPLPSSGSKPVPPGRKPRFIVEGNSPGTFQDTAESGSSSRFLQSALNLSVPGEPIGPTRPSSTKPPPPPSPRVKSPRPRVSTEFTRPLPLDPQNIFADYQNGRIAAFEDSIETQQFRPEFSRKESSDDCRSSSSVPSSGAQKATSAAPTPFPKKASINITRSRDGSPDQSMTGTVTPRAASPPYKMSTPTRRAKLVEEGQKPALPSRPISLHANAGGIMPIDDLAARAEESKPELPRRIKAVNSHSITTDQVPVDSAPRLPSRTNTTQSGRTSMERDPRLSLQSDRHNQSEGQSISRRSLDTSRSFTSKKMPATAPPFFEDSDDEDEPVSAVEISRSSEQPDASTANRKPPRFKGTHWDLLTGKEVRKTALSGDLLVIAHAEKIKLHNLLTDEMTWQIPVVDTRVTAMDFRSVNPDNLSDAGRFLWIGYKDGSLHELDIRNRVIVERYFHAHSGAIVAILRHSRAMWTLDEVGTLQMWSTKSAISLKGKPSCSSMRTVLGVNAALVVDGLLWIGTGRTVHVFSPLSPVDHRRLTPERGLESTKVTGMITCVVHLHHNPEVIYFGHDDGKISVYSRDNPRCLEVVSISHYNLSGLLAVGDYLWASFKTGKIFVYDVHARPWRVMKEWQAHKSPIQELALDRTSLWKEKRMQVSTMAGDGAIKVWDGLLMDDWMDAEMQRRIKDFSTFRKLSALVCTWNAGASVPQKLSRDYEDAQFIEKMIQGAKSPDIIVFGFQELVDLDDKGKAGRSVAKGFFGKKKEKEPDEKVQAAAYLQWQNHLEKQVSLASEEGYSLLQVRSLVGLFTCVFIKKQLLGRISNVEASSVKTGLKGRYGNKGGIVIRFTVDDTSVCFVNCHLAAGQKHTIQRNNDVFSILDQAGLSAPAEDLSKRNVFVCGGDGSMVLDHEVCILNGDLNYRINGARSNVLQHIKEGRLNKLLEGDQLLGELKKNSTHRLRSFTEHLINFPPTYKYDPGTDNYDSSEKMRVPAWCDRVYYRGLGSSDIESLAYQAHVCRVSDHRPVSALLTMHVKTVDRSARKEVYDEVVKTWVDLANKTIVARKIAVLSEVTGRSERECREALRASKGQIVSDAALALV